MRQYSERQEAIRTAPSDRRAHARERLDDAPHGTARERRIARERREERLRRKNPQQKTQRRAGISRIEDALRLFQAMQTDARDEEGAVRLPLDACAERPHARRRRKAVRRFEEVSDAHLSFRYGRKHHAAM